MTIQDIARSRVDIPRTEQWVMQSRVENRKYKIMVAIPSEAAPPSGYPVIYLLDGNSVFTTMVEALRMQCHRPDKTGVVPAIIVGIGYQTNRPFAPDRYYDYTPVPSFEYQHKSDGTPLPEQGGAQAFLSFIEEELKPHIEQEFNINSNRQTIFGHSLGGLFALYVLFTKPAAFQHYIAGSPSIHWNKEFLLEEEQRFVGRLEQESINVELLIGMGQLENSHVSRNLYQAKELSDRLSIHSDRGVNVTFTEFEDEGHVSVLPVLISRALRLVLKPEK
ncbi:enterobactin esterase [Paenibacillus glacialis]|uniref:Enterobactin esterase n=1 Tax=Paenibacillus glacialis TaxID=494026 RepID=A0A168HS33_9BACL|nr:enterobactin esterase [Paenibacillus glacialis]